MGSNVCGNAAWQNLGVRSRSKEDPNFCWENFWLPPPSFVCGASINPPIIISFGRLNWAKSKGLWWVVFNFHRHIIIYYQSKKMVETEIVDPITMQRNAAQGSKQRKPCQNSNFGLQWFSEFVELFPALHWLVLKVTKLNYFLDIIDLQQYSLGSLTYVRQFLILNLHHLLVNVLQTQWKKGSNPYYKPLCRTLWVQSDNQFKLNMASLNLLFPPHLLRVICAEPLTTWEQFMERSLLKIAILINNFLPSISVFAVWSVAFSRPFS